MFCHQAEIDIALQNTTLCRKKFGEMLFFATLLDTHSIYPFFFSIFAAATCGFALGWIVCSFASIDDDKRPGRYSQLHFIGAHYSGEDAKMVLCLRSDLEMDFNRAASQLGHACIGMYKSLASQKVGLVENWEDCGQPKVVVRVNSRDELLHVRFAARDAGVSTFVTKEGASKSDESGEVVVLAMLGPTSLVDKVTKGLKLFSEFKSKTS